MAGRRDTGGGLSPQTLVIASLSSLAAALVVHKVWQGGAFVGAAITPVIVALVSEALRRPAERLSTRNPPPVVTPQREDRFGIWEEQRPRRRLHVGLAIGTGLIAFAVAAFALTGAELVLGGASDGDRFRVLPGKQERSSASRDTRRDEPAERTPAQPEEEQPPPADEPPATEPPAETAPEEEQPPPDTVTAPDPGATAPAEP